MCSREKEIFDVLKERLCRSRERHHDIMRRTSRHLHRSPVLSFLSHTNFPTHRVTHTTYLLFSGEW